MMFDSLSPPKGTIRDWLDYRADTAPNDTCFFFSEGEEPLTWLALRDMAHKIAVGLTIKGIERGESVAFCMSNGCASLLTVFGILYGGFRVTPLNLAAGPAALGHAISHSRCRFICSASEQERLLAQALSQTDANPEIIDAVDAFSNQDVSIFELVDVTETDHALLMYTSGTTGVPKGVVHTNASLLAGGWTTAVAHKLQQNDRALCVLPLYHINGLCVTVIAPLVSGGSSVICPKFSNSSFWDDCGKFNVTWFSVVPTIISHLLHGKKEPNEATRKNIRFGRSASAPLAADTQSSFETRFGLPIVETMGLTETAAQILSNPLPPATRKIGSPGIPFGNEVKILKPDGYAQEVNQVGEIAIRGPNVMLEYLDNAAATEQTKTPEGWLLTGDLGYMDDDGYVFVSGRLKELIIKGGENIAPREIDDALYAHPDVVEAGAFAILCDTYGQRVEAAVKLASSSVASEADLIELCQSRLGKFKSPDRIHFLEELPKGPSGKIQRLKLVDLFGK
jgi:acyl-CoA synthetase (AMP-forming)/AMP-acid ligase II